MPFLSIWVDLTGRSQHDWDEWVRLSKTEEVPVQPFGSLGEEPAIGGDQAWRYLQLLALLAADKANAAKWTLLLPASTYVHIKALKTRLNCFDASNFFLFGRLAGRLEPKIPSFGGAKVPVPKLSGGLIVSWGALLAGELGRLGSEVCSLEEVSYFAGKSWKEVGPVSSSLDQVGFTGDDYTLAFCLAMARLPRPLTNFGSYLDHYVLGPDVLSRLAYRTAYIREETQTWLRGRTWRSKFFTNRTKHFDDSASERGDPAPDAPPCLLFAGPVPLRSAHPWADLLWRGGCDYADLATYSVQGERRAGNTMFEVQNVGYSWWDGSAYQASTYYDGEVWASLKKCVVTTEHRGGPILELPKLPKKLLRRKLSTNLFLLLGLPGGGSSWVASALHHALEPLGAELVTDLFHPFCHEPWRAELSLLLGAPEDESYPNIWRGPGRGFEPLAQLASWVLGDVEVAVSKEVVNVPRVKQFQKLGAHVFALYRARHDMFPLGDEGVGFQEFCRTCFFRQMFASFMEEAVPDLVLASLRPRIASLVTTDEEGAVLLHTATWYFLLKQNVPVVSYEALITLPRANVALEFERVIGGPYRRSLELGNATVSGLADRFADYIARTRRPASFLRTKRALYDATNIEPKVQLLLQAIRHQDPSTDIGLLFDG